VIWIGFPKFGHIYIYIFYLQAGCCLSLVFPIIVKLFLNPFPQLHILLIVNAVVSNLISSSGHHSCLTAAGSYCHFFVLLCYYSLSTLLATAATFPVSNNISIFFAAHSFIRSQMHHLHHRLYIQGLMYKISLISDSLVVIFIININLCGKVI